MSTTSRLLSAEFASRLPGLTPVFSEENKRKKERLTTDLESVYS